MSDNSTHTLPAYLPYSMGLLWLWSGTQPLFFIPGMSLDLLHSVGIPDPLQWPTLIVASLLDIGFAFLCFSRLRSRSEIWLLQLITVAAYSLIIAFRLPEMWAHPFSPLLKNLPIMATLFFLYQSGGDKK
ncbi:DoxX-like family protein [Neisseria sp. P0015.S010]